MTIARASVALLAAWSLFATTVFVFFLVEGGVYAPLRLLTSPQALFAPRELAVWALGAAGAFGVFLVAFLLCQGVGRGLLRLLRPRLLPWPEGLPLPSYPVRLLEFDSQRPDAFTFTLLVPSLRGPWQRTEVILLSTGLLRVLTFEEREAVVAHELGHVRDLDGRYLTFVRTFARLMRWDPILAFVAARLTRREEFRADADAVDLTRRPRALARAIYKASRLAPARSGVLASLLGPGGRRGASQANERIHRLVELAESGRYAEELVG